MVHKIEVVTSVERRRRYSDDQKQRIVEEALAPGSSISATARKRGISPSLIFNWRKALQPTGQIVIHDEPPLLPAPELGSAALLVEIQAEVARFRSATSNSRAHCPPAIKARVTEALAAGFSAAHISRATGLSEKTVGRCRVDCMPVSPPALRELRVIVDEPMATHPAGPKPVSIKVGAVATIELPVDALSVELLRALVDAGGRR